MRQCIDLIMNIKGQHFLLQSIQEKFWMVLGIDYIDVLNSAVKLVKWVLGTSRRSVEFF